MSREGGELVVPLPDPGRTQQIIDEVFTSADRERAAILRLLRAFADLLDKGRVDGDQRAAAAVRICADSIEAGKHGTW